MTFCFFLTFFDLAIQKFLFTASENFYLILGKGRVRRQQGFCDTNAGSLRFPENCDDSDQRFACLYRIVWRLMDNNADIKFSFKVNKNYF